MQLIKIPEDDLLAGLRLQAAQGEKEKDKERCSRSHIVVILCCRSAIDRIGGMEQKHIL